MWSKVRSNERLVNQMQGATARSPMSAAGRRWHRCFFSPSVSLSLSPSLCVPACISRQWPDSFPDSLPQSPSVLTGPHKQGHSDCCKRKMYHLLGDGWHDVSAKAFILTRSITATLQLSPPLPSNWTRRQKTTATWAAKEIASSAWWKIHKPLVKNGFIRSTTWPKMAEDRLRKLEWIFNDLSGQWCKGQ